MWFTENHLRDTIHIQKSNVRREDRKLQYYTMPYIFEHSNMVYFFVIMIIIWPSRKLQRSSNKESFLKIVSKSCDEQILAFIYAWFIIDIAMRNLTRLGYNVKKFAKWFYSVGSSVSKSYWSSTFRTMKLWVHFSFELKLISLDPCKLCKTNKKNSVYQSYLAKF